MLVDASKMIERGRALERGRKRERSSSRAEKKEKDDIGEVEMVDADISKTQLKKQRRAKSEAAKRDPSVTRSHSRPRDPSKEGLHTNEAIKAAKMLERKQGRMGWKGAAGEGDQRKAVHLVKWMNTGKKRMGTHYCR